MNFFLMPSTVGAASNMQFLTSYVINDAVAIDAGSIGFSPDLTLQRSIRHVLLTHGHIDHIASLGPLIDNAHSPNDSPLTIHCTEQLAESLREDYFNDRVWPNVFNFPKPQAPRAELRTFEPGQTLKIGGFEVVPVEVDHVVPTVGFIVQDAACTMVFGADSSATDEIWTRANTLGNVKAAVLEVAFPNRWQERADLAKHLTPQIFADEVKKIAGSARVFAVHLKPSVHDEILQELSELELDRVEVCVPGRKYEV